MMDDIDTLLIAFMFITILTLGIATVLSALGELVRSVGRERRDGLLVGWTLLLLFAYFHLFWHTADITALEDLDFWLLLFVQTGPILLLFATEIMTGALTASADEGPDAAMRQSRFFVVFGLLQLWSLATGPVWGLGFTFASALDVVVLLVCAALATSRSRPLHVSGLTVVWIAYLASAILDTRVG